MQNSNIPYTSEDFFAIKSEAEFLQLALEAFKYQYKTNSIYQKFVNLMRVDSTEVRCLDQIPFLPIELFKDNVVVSGNCDELSLSKSIVFGSSGTTSAIKSKHYVTDISLYIQTLTEGFKMVFGNPANYSFLALLPGYMERQDSSLIYMVNELMKQSRQQKNLFFKEASPDFFEVIDYNQKNQIQTILFGVSYSLLEFAHKNPISLEGVILIETGGMKGKMEEKTRSELHEILKDKLRLEQVYSEYGMTELLSQAYSTKNEEFELPPWMQILIREPNDPLHFLGEGKVGGINIIDLANIHSCCFIGTQDLGKKTSPNTFEVLGRFDNADMRGCNLLFPYGM